MSCGGGCGQVVLGAVPGCGVLPLVRGGDFGPENLTRVVDGVECAFPAGELFFRLATKPVETRWSYRISGAVASLKVAADEVVKVPDRTPFQLVWLAAGDLGGGRVLLTGKVRFYS